jgi:hypothetical protein
MTLFTFIDVGLFIQRCDNLRIVTSVEKKIPESSLGYRFSTKQTSKSDSIGT